MRKGNETCEYACGMPALIPGKVLEVSNGVKCEEHRYPHGVVGKLKIFQALTSPQLEVSEKV